MADFWPYKIPIISRSTVEREQIKGSEFTAAQGIFAFGPKKNQCGGTKMHVKRLTWVFAGLFVLFGLLIPVTEDTGWLRWCAGLSTLSLGGFGLSMAGDALAQGKIRVQFSVVRKANQPWLFWAVVVLVAAAGAGTSIAGLWFLFFKNWA